jgi:hypothetical protein
VLCIVILRNSTKDTAENKSLITDIEKIVALLAQYFGADLAMHVVTWLVATATWAYVLPAFVGVWLSFSAKHLKQILANIALHIHNFWHEESPTRGSPSELVPLLPRPESPAQASKRTKAKKSEKALAKIYKAGGGVRDFLVFCFNKNLSLDHRILLCLFVLFLSLAMVGFIILGVYVARIRANGPAIVDCKKCGLWVFNRQKGGDESATRAGIRDLEKETRAGEYAQNCYGTPDMFDVIQCNFLYRSRLSFSPAEYTSDCPFQNEICDRNETVTFTTDTVDATELGINSRHPPKFHRRTSCTPLSMECPFIQPNSQWNNNLLLLLWRETFARSSTQIHLRNNWRSL